MLYPFIYLNGPNCGVEGLSIYYPNQQQTNPPVQYPFCIGGAGDDLFVKDVFLVNPYMGIDFATNPCGRHLIEQVYGQPLAIGIAVDQCYDIGRINTIHFWPFWSLQADVLNFQQLNGVSFQFYRSDWEIVENVFSLGYHMGMAFLQSANGALNGQFSDINFDSSDIGLYIQNTQEWGIMFSNLNIANDGKGNTKIGVYGVPGGSGFAVIRGYSLWGLFNQAVNWNNAGTVAISNSIFQQWNSTFPCIDFVSGRGIARGNYFHDTIGVAVSIGPNTDRVMVVDNELVGNTIVNDGTDTLIANNHY